MWCEVCVVCVAICYQGVYAGPYMSPAALLAFALFHNLLPLSIFCSSLSITLTWDSNDSLSGGCRFLSGFLLGLGVAPPLVTCISPSHITLVHMSACSVSVCSSSPFTVPAIAPSLPPSVSSPSGSWFWFFHGHSTVTLHWEEHGLGKEVSVHHPFRFPILQTHHIHRRTGPLLYHNMRACLSSVP